MNNVPMSMAEVQATVAARMIAGDDDVTAAAVIERGLENWAQELLDEGFEGSYFTPKIAGAEMTITDVADQVVARLNVPDDSYVAAFEDNPRGTVLNIQLALRGMIDEHQITL